MMKASAGSVHKRGNTGGVAAFALAVALAGGFGAASPARAAEVPGGDIFGFTSGAEIGDPGEHGAAFELDGAFGVRTGRYTYLGQKYGYSRVIAPDTELGVSLFTAYHSLRNDPAEPIDRSALQFDGIGVELGRQLIRRNDSNPFSVKLAVEPRWARLTGGGRHTNAYGAEFRLAIDAAIVPDTLFWAAQIGLGVMRERDPEMKSKWETGSELKASTALTMQLAPGVFAGVEATYVRAHDNVLGNFAGHALFAGPTLAVRLGENAMLNLTVAPQIAGRARGVPMRLDLDNFNRAISRVKLAVDF